MHIRNWVVCLCALTILGTRAWAAPVIDPLPAVTIPAGKSLIVPITCTVTNGLPVTFTVTSSTNRILVEQHTNNPFWQLSVAQLAASNAPGAYQTPFRGGLATVTNVGVLTFMLFPEYAPHAVNVFQGLTTCGFFNSNTIFHFVSSNSFVVGGDAFTNGSGRLVADYDDEIVPQAVFSGSGQLALNNFGPDTDGSQFFVTVGPHRTSDLEFTLFGQLVRGFDILTNLSVAPVNANGRPSADEIIETARFVADTTDTVVTLTATNLSGVNATITVIADDGAGGRATNTFVASTLKDTNSNNQAFIYPNTMTNLLGPINKTLTNFITATELNSDTLYWFPFYVTQADIDHTAGFTGNYLTNRFKALTYNVTNIQGRLQLFLKPLTNYVGPVSLIFDVSYNSQWSLYKQLGLSLPAYDEQKYTFVFGDTPIAAQARPVTAQASGPFANVVLGTFTNGVPGSSGTNFTAAINWGDNSTNTGIVTANSAGQKAVLGSHTYQYPGTYPVYTRVQSRIGASATILSYVTVTNQSIPATNLLTVQITGEGTVSPAYSNALLNVGESYSLSAASTGTWVLVSWTDGNGFVLGTGTNLTFTMSQGFSLTANFALAVPPTLTIVSPTSGSTLTNLYSAPVTVAGTAANNASVTAVWYQLNSGAWQQADGTLNWTASFTPQYGVTNQFKAYAVNNFGYVSATNTLLVKYLAGDILNVMTNGLGSITPNLNHLLLPLGTNYVVTAKTNVGFAFSGWTGSVPTNKAALTFKMATNLTLIANFTETAKPTVTITSPANHQKMTNALAHVVGTASDPWGVQGVWLQLNGNAWNQVSTANAFSNWTASLTLTSGTNTIKTYGQNLGGLRSSTNSISIVSSNTFKLQLVFTNGQPLRPDGLAFSLQLSKGLNGQIQVSTNLTDWITFSNFTGLTTNLNFRDPSATNFRGRFYRAVVP